MSYAPTRSFATTSAYVEHMHISESIKSKVLSCRAELHAQSANGYLIDILTEIRMVH